MVIRTPLDVWELDLLHNINPLHFLANGEDPDSLRLWIQNPLGVYVINKKSDAIIIGMKIMEQDR